MTTTDTAKPAQVDFTLLIDAYAALTLRQPVTIWLATYGPRTGSVVWAGSHFDRTMGRLIADEDPVLLMDSPEFWAAIDQRRDSAEINREIHARAARVAAKRIA